MKNKILSLALLMALFLMLALPIAAQGEQLQISLRKQFGGDFGSKIQGQFLLQVRGGPGDLAGVTYYLDGNVLGETVAPNLAYSFSTDNYAPGPHEITAEGRAADGTIYTSNTLQVEFITGEEMGKMVGTIIVPILALVVLAAIIPVIMAVTGGRKTPPAPGEPRSYGLLGGTVCKRCGQPYPIHWWSLRLGFARLDRCPYCGNLTLIQRASPETLKQAEEALVAQAKTAGPTIPEKSAEDKLREQIDKSRYL
jgi:hypothetical protein